MLGFVYRATFASCAGHAIAAHFSIAMLMVGLFPGVFIPRKPLVSGTHAHIGFDGVGFRTFDLMSLDKPR